VTQSPKRVVTGLGREERGGIGAVEAEGAGEGVERFVVAKAHGPRPVVRLQPVHHAVELDRRLSAAVAEGKVEHYPELLWIFRHNTEKDLSEPAPKWEAKAERGVVRVEIEIPSK